MCFMLSGFAYVYTVRCIIPIECSASNNLYYYLLSSPVAVPRVCVCVCVCVCVSVRIFVEVISVSKIILQ